MLGVEPTIPVDFGVIEAESALFVSDFNVQVWVSSKELKGKGSKDAFSTNIGGFVDYRANGRVLVQNNGGDYRFVGEILLAEVEMRFQSFSGLKENDDKQLELRTNMTYNGKA